MKKKETAGPNKLNSQSFHLKNVILTTKFSFQTSIISPVILAGRLLIYTFVIFHTVAESSWLRSFGMIRITVNDPQSLGVRAITGASKKPVKHYPDWIHASAPLVHHDPNDHPKETRPGNIRFVITDLAQI